MEYNDFINELEVLHEEANSLFDSENLDMDHKFRKWRHRTNDLINRIIKEGYYLDCNINARSFGDVNGAVDSYRKTMFNTELQDTINEIETIIENFRRYGSPKKENKKYNKNNNIHKIWIALIGIIPACLAAFLGYMQGYKSTDFQRSKTELSEKRISFKRSSNPNFKELVYPNYGISLLAPVSWTAEDSPAVLAGGEFNLISRYEDTRGAVGMNFRLRPVQPNYINNISAQIENQRITFERNFPGTTVEDITLSGLPGKLFTYVVKTGKREMKVRLYWIRLIPDVQLQIQVAQYTDAADYDEFWKQVDQIISSIVIAFDTWQARYKEMILPEK